jgi:hypothetical membrane protein
VRAPFVGARRGVVSERLLLAGAVAGPLFVAAFLIEGSLEPGYSALRHPVSSLVLGTHGWAQTCSFEITGALYVALAIGLARVHRLRAFGPRAGAALVAVLGVGLLGAGLFHTDPVGGFPPGTPDVRVYSTSGAVHDAFSALLFLGLPVAALLYGRWFRRQRPGWALYCRATCLAFIACFVLSSVAFNQTPGFVAYGGLLQRLTIVIGFAWLTALALAARRPSGITPTDGINPTDGR